MDADQLLAAKQLREFTLHVDVEGEPVAILLRALPRSEYRALLDNHPPTDDKADWNPDTFCPALIAACAVEPAFTVEQAQQVWDRWESEEASRLFLAAYYLNEDHKRLGFISLGSVRTRGSGQNSTTASPGESPTPSS